MKVLIGCEFSGTVRDAFTAYGHDAWSCDVLPSERPGQHIQGDLLEHLDKGWDLLIAHPPCTYLCSSGMHWTVRGKRDPKLTEDALTFVRQLLDAPIQRIAVENPVGAISTRIRPYDQKIQPWMFGDDASKGTCLWLKGLPKLFCTSIVPPKGWQEVRFAFEMPDCDMHFADCPCLGPTQDGVTYRTIDTVLFGTLVDPAPHPVWSNQTPSGQNKLGPSPKRSAERARTYPGIATAMARQWGAL